MTRLTLKNIYVYIPCSFQDMNTDARTHDVFRLSSLKSLQKHRRKCYRGVCVCVCGRGVVRGGTSPRGSPLWAGWRQWNNHRSQFTRERETETAASQGYSGRSEVRRDGLQGVFRCTVDVHVLERRTHQCQTKLRSKYSYLYNKLCSRDHKYVVWCRVSVFALVITSSFCRCTVVFIRHIGCYGFQRLFAIWEKFCFNDAPAADRASFKLCQMLR